MADEYFQRVIDLSLISADGKQKTFSYDSENEKFFAIEFEVEFGIGAHSAVRLFNPNQTTVDMCRPNPAKRQFAKLELTAGYSFNKSLIAAGSIVSALMKRKNADTVLELKITNSVSELNSLARSPNSFSNLPGDMIFRQILQANGFVNYSVSLDTVPVIENFTAPGTVKQALNDLCLLCSASLHFDGSKIVITSKKTKVTGDTPVMHFHKTGGLVGQPEQKGAGYLVKTLLEPKLQKGKKIRLSFRDLSGMEIKEQDFLIDKGKHTGGSYIPNYITEFECRKV